MNIMAHFKDYEEFKCLACEKIFYSRYEDSVYCCKECKEDYEFLKGVFDLRY